MRPPTATRAIFSSTVGGGIGALVAAQLSHFNVFLGLLGLALGAVVGYVVCGWREILHAIPVAAKKAWNSASSWRPDPLFWRQFGWQFLWMFSTLTTLFTFALVFAWVSDRPPSPDTVLMAVLIGMVLSVSIALLGTVGFNDGHWPKELLDEKRREMIESYREAFFHTSLPVVLFWHLPRVTWLIVGVGPWVLRALGDTVWFLAKAVPLVARFVGLFFWHVFILTRSERLTICATDALLGAALGFFTGPAVASHVGASIGSASALLGATGGCLFGIADHHFIQPWLEQHRLVPVKAKK